MAETTPTVVRDLGDGRIGIWTAFAHKDACKALPGARWDPNLKAWTVPTACRPEAQALAERLNGSAGDGLAVAVSVLLQATPEHLRTATYRGLAQAWHPDRGGDTRAMQALTAARGEMS
ncbi:MAG: hypothetical protein ACR2JF_11860 [Iamia sp.]